MLMQCQEISQVFPLNLLSLIYVARKISFGHYFLNRFWNNLNRFGPLKGWLQVRIFGLYRIKTSSRVSKGALLGGRIFWSPNKEHGSYQSRRVRANTCLLWDTHLPTTSFQSAAHVFRTIYCWSSVVPLTIVLQLNLWRATDEESFFCSYC